MKYKVGDKVRIVANTNGDDGHDFNIGTVVTIIDTNRASKHFSYACEDDTHNWWVSGEDIEPAVVYQYLIVNTLSGIMFTTEDENEQYLFTKKQVIEHLNNDIAYPSQWTIVSADKIFNVNSIMEEEVK